MHRLITSIGGLDRWIVVKTASVTVVVKIVVSKTLGSPWDCERALSAGDQVADQQREGEFAAVVSEEAVSGMLTPVIFGSVKGLIKEIEQLVEGQVSGGERGLGVRQLCPYAAAFGWRGVVALARSSLRPR